MNKKYIDADKLMEFANNQIGGIDSNVIARFPKEDVVEVRRGEWKVETTHNGCTFDYDCVCSVCGKSGTPNYNYCPNCGARMDGEE